jgi:hypothetical protein
MLRLQLRKSPPRHFTSSAVGAIEASIWWNPTHADTPGATRGLRVNGTIRGALAAMNFNASGGGALALSAAVRGGAGMKVDYIGVYSA